MTPDTHEPRLNQLKIGSNRYSIATDDEYLRSNGPGVKVRIKNALKALVGRNTFEPRMTRLFSTLIQPTDTVLDIGANIGCTTLVFSELGSHVHAFEPLGKNSLFSGETLKSTCRATSKFISERRSQDSGAVQSCRRNGIRCMVPGRAAAHNAA